MEQQGTRAQQENASQDHVLATYFSGRLGSINKHHHQGSPSSMLSSASMLLARDGKTRNRAKDPLHTAFFQPRL